MISKRSSLFAAAIACVAFAAAAALPFVNGEVRKVDPTKGTVVLKHGDIPNLGMPAMAMEFHAEAKLLKTVKPGDKVKFQADMVGGKLVLVGFERAGK